MASRKTATQRGFEQGFRIAARQMASAFDFEVIAVVPDLQAIVFKRPLSNEAQIICPSIHREEMEKRWDFVHAGERLTR